MSQKDDDYWKRIAELEPFWAVLSQDKYRGSELAATTVAEFYADGERDMEFIRDLIVRFIEPAFAPKTALDFGCGVGRLVLPMSKIAGSVYGVDISPEMLKIANDAVTKSGTTNVRLSADIPDVPLDWINSYIVFQHIMPRDGAAILRTLLDKLAENGVISLHFTIFRDQQIIWRGIMESAYGRFDGERFVSYERNEVKDMPIYEYDLSEVMMLLTRAGVKTVVMRHTNHGGAHGVVVCGRKTE